MIDFGTIEQRLCRTFCAGISVRPVPSGYAVSSVFQDNSGDRLSFYVIEEEENSYRLEDSGDFLANLKASGIDFEVGQRGQLLEQILKESGSFWDQDTYEIKSDEFTASDLGDRMIKFTTALLRVRDVSLLTREFVRSTFREDAIRIFEERYSDQYTSNDNEPVDGDFLEYPSDLIIRPNSKQESKAAAVYFVSDTAKLLEAQLMFQHAKNKERSDVSVVALIEKLNKVSSKKFQRAQNNGLIMPIFDGDEVGAIDRIGSLIGLKITA